MNNESTIETRLVQSNKRGAKVTTLILNNEIIAIEVMHDNATIQGVRNNSMFSCTNLEHFGYNPYSFSLIIGDCIEDAIEPVYVHSLNDNCNDITLQFRWECSEWGVGYNTHIPMAI